MSDYWLKFVPSDPLFMPTVPAAQQAKALLTSFVPHAQAVHIQFLKPAQFIHPGEIWSGVKCPTCGSDAQQWWKVAMSTAYKNAFADLKVTAPCCGKRVSLHDMDYITAAGIARFVLQAMNPDVDNLTPAQERELAACLGCALRKIWVSG